MERNTNNDRFEYHPNTRTGIIGAGRIGQVHLDTLASVPGVNPVIISDVVEPVLKMVTEKYGVPKYTMDVSRAMSLACSCSCCFFASLVFSVPQFDAFCFCSASAALRRHGPCHLCSRCCYCRIGSPQAQNIILLAYRRACCRYSTRHAWYPADLKQEHAHSPPENTFTKNTIRPPRISGL